MIKKASTPRWMLSFLLACEKKLLIQEYFVFLHRRFYRKRVSQWPGLSYCAVYISINGGNGCFCA